MVQKLISKDLRSAGNFLFVAVNAIFCECVRLRLKGYFND